MMSLSLLVVLSLLLTLVDRLLHSPCGWACGYTLQAQREVSNSQETALFSQGAKSHLSRTPILRDPELICLVLMPWREEQEGNGRLSNKIHPFWSPGQFGTRAPQRACVDQPTPRQWLISGAVVTDSEASWHCKASVLQKSRGNPALSETCSR